jgi:hypothetical protein
MTEAEKKAEYAKQFKAQVAPETQSLIKKLYNAIFGAGDPVPTPAPTPAPAPAKLEKTFKTKDGLLSISVAAEVPAAGVAVIDPATGNAIPDGTYLLEDGSSITVAAGLITDYTAAAPLAPPMDMTAATTALKAQFAAEKVEFEKTYSTKFKALEDKNKELEKTVTDQVEINKTVVKFMHDLINTPIPDEPKKKETVQFKKLSEKEISELSPLQQMKYNRGEDYQ